ncbi:hypothetical protein RB594_006519 [Gaeumannomyces avenae]
MATSKAPASETSRRSRHSSMDSDTYRAMVSAREDHLEGGEIWFDHVLLEGEEIGFDHVLFEATRQFPDEYAQARALTLEARPVIRELEAVVGECEADLLEIYAAYVAYQAATSLRPASAHRGRISECLERREEAISKAKGLCTSMGSLQMRLNVVCENLAQAGTEILPQYKFLESHWGAELGAMDRGPAMIAALFPRTFGDIKQATTRVKKVTPATLAAASGDFKRFHRAMREDRRIDGRTPASLAAGPS